MKHVPRSHGLVGHPKLLSTHRWNFIVIAHSVGYYNSYLFVFSFFFLPFHIVRSLRHSNIDVSLEVSKTSGLGNEGVPGENRARPDSGVNRETTCPRDLNCISYQTEFQGTGTPLPRCTAGLHLAHYISYQFFDPVCTGSCCAAVFAWRCYWQFLVYERWAINSGPHFPPIAVASGY